MKRALITGITGQDGSYLAELLLSKGYEVHGTLRRVALDGTDDARVSRVAHLPIVWHTASMESAASIYRAVEKSEPDEIYHLAAQSFVTDSFGDAETTIRTNILGTMHVLDAVLAHGPSARLYYAATSEMFGRSPAPQNEQTPFEPVSPYAASKLAGYHLCRAYRDAHGLPVSCGILFNHESPRRGREFVTRKITAAVAAIKAGKQDTLHLGNTAARRDWGHARDYVRAMWLMLQQDRPDDYVIATGETRSVQDFVKAAFRAADLDWRQHVESDYDYLRRPNEVNELRGDASKARTILGWLPEISFSALVHEMVEHDLEKFSGAIKP